MKVRIRRSNPEIPFPEYKTRDAAAFDFASSEDMAIPPKSVALIPTGLYIQSPEGYFLAIFSRSSMPLKKGLSIPHGVGVLDPDYSGPNDQVLIQLYNFTDQPVEVKKGERVAQGMFLPVRQIEWEEAHGLRENSRGGFGSTGHN
jgi:dUTP pyrophosphatase